MHKSKFIVSITVIVIAGMMMLLSVIFALIHVASNFYQDIQYITIEPHSASFSHSSVPFSLQADQSISFWLKVPNQDIEHQDSQITLSLFNKNGSLLTSINKNFNSSFSRHSTGKQHYYKLGKHHFETAFDGVLQSRFDGSWRPLTTSNIVLRQISPTVLPMQQFYLFLLGSLLLFIGIKAVEKYSP